MIRPLPSLVASLLVALPLAAFDAHAQSKIYKCKNEKGELYYSQTYDPARCGGGGAQLNDQGIAVKPIERIKSPEELAAEKEAADRAAAEKKIADAKAREDQILMQSYANEGELARVHQEELKALDSTIATTRMSMKNQEKSLAEYLASAAEFERAGKPVPPQTSKNIATVRKQIEEQTAYIASKEAEKKSVTQAFEAKRARFRELKTAQDKQLSGQ